ncbi:MAG: hypothetical protein GY862_03370 [Gammaproteobacteria bacterium]|nr:hypothetical protein [Gammaproteobacteria bacterium]
METTQERQLPVVAPATTFVKHSQFLANYVYEARLLLAYATRQGLDIDRELVDAIVRAGHQAEEGSWTEEGESEFWLAFKSISKLAPISIASLMATTSFHENEGESDNRGWLRRIFIGASQKMSPAKQAVIFYQRGALVVLAVLLTLQAYWMIGSAIATDIAVTLPKEIAAAEKQIAEEKKKTALELMADSQEIGTLHAQIENYNNRIAANYQMLKEWNIAWKLFMPDLSRQGEQEVSALAKEVWQNLILLQEAQFVLQIIQLYLLPLLYGLLGAFAYVLRTLTVEIRTLTYGVHCNIGYRLRIQLGALAGLAIGWFTNAGGPPSAFTSLSPLALAFLVGYSVELLFALMDRLISSFTSSDGEKTQLTKQQR